MSEIDDLITGDDLSDDAREFLLRATGRDRALTVYAPKELPPCPPWCRYREQFPEHGYDTVLDVEAGEPYTFLRSHTSDQTKTAYLVQDETYRDGVVTLGQPEVFVVGHSFGMGEELTPEVARERAADLLRAAEECDRVLRS